MLKYLIGIYALVHAEESENITQIATKIKDALQDVENKLTIGVKPICVPCCVPLCDFPYSENKNEVQKKEPLNNGCTFDPPKVMVCYREPCKKKKGNQQDTKPEVGVIRLQQSKSRELRASILYTGCQCEKRDGLQDDCPRTGCHGSPECLTAPPTCGPSEFCDGKHLGKKNKYDYLNRKNGKNHNAGGENNNGAKNNMARYKCYAATVDTPIVCCSSCPPCPPFLSKKHPEPYYGTKIGPLQEFGHGIKGTVFAVDESTIFIKGFSYDGTGPDAFFWIGNSPRPSPEGIIIPYPEDFRGRDPPVLKAHNNTDIILRLPMGKRIRDIRWLSVWCRRFTVDFGEVFIPPNLEVPKPRVLPEFKRLAHGLRSDNISILDAKTFYIPNLHYDGGGPDAYFWVGNGSEPTAFGIKVPNEMGSLEPLRGYFGEDIEIQLPGSLTVYDIDWLAVWCVQYRHNFGHVMIPKDLDVPPALGQTKISTTTTPVPAPTNCREFLDKRLQVRWLMRGDSVEITLSANIGEDKYFAFGLSGVNNKAQMIGADVTVAYFDKNTRSFHADDYYISHASQCDGKSGVCPDERIGGRNDVIVLHGERENGITTIKYTKPLHTNEAINDRPIPEDESVSVIAAFGPLNSQMEANAHLAKDRTFEDNQINFSDLYDHQCTLSLDELPPEDGIQPWPPAKIVGENTFYLKIGPTGGARGYSKITGLPSWGICYYINDKLIPELTVERGQTYTFIVEGGIYTTNPARFHPVYITDSNEGAFGQINQEKRRHQQVFAGVAYDKEGSPYPTATGRFCEWAHKSIDKALESETFEDYMKTLRLECDEGEPAYLNWTVPMDAPDLLYYQCYIHSNLGWKIHVVDPGYISQQNGEKQINKATTKIIHLGSSTSILMTIIVIKTIIKQVKHIL